MSYQRHRLTRPMPDPYISTGYPIDGPDNRIQRTNSNVLIVIMLFAAFVVGAGVTAVVIRPSVKVDLPEEAGLITSTDHLKGHWEDKTLVIEFDNPNNHEKIN